MAKLLNYWRFEAGSAVPDFLVDAEPLQPGIRPEIFFPVDTDVFETEERFVCIPADDASPTGTIHVRGGVGRHDIFAVHKPVAAVSRWQTAYPVPKPSAPLGSSPTPSP